MMEPDDDESYLTMEHPEEQVNWDLAPRRPTLRRCHGEWEDDEHLELLVRAQEAAMMARRSQR